MQRHLQVRIVNLNHTWTHSNTHTKFHQNRFSRLGGVQSQTHVQKNYIYKDNNLKNQNDLEEFLKLTLVSLFVKHCIKQKV